MTTIAAEAYRNLLLQFDGHLATITMNRPERRNALSLDHMRELIACFNDLGASHDIRVVVIRGAGPAFCAGHDLSEMVGRDVAFYRQLFEVCVELMTVIQAIPQPVIAQVHGMATAAGCQLVATCDLAVATEEARFATPGVRIGLFCSTPMVALSRAVGRKRAMEMLLTGDSITGPEALAAGLVNRVVPEANLEGAVRALAGKIAASSNLVVGIGKQAFYQQVEMPLPHAYAYTREVMAMNSLAEDAQEGMGAFLDKRSPEWRGC
jgi:enoyl-CoA hydratase/carnithine racemase